MRRLRISVHIRKKAGGDDISKTPNPLSCLVEDLETDGKELAVIYGFSSGSGSDNNMFLVKYNTMIGPHLLSSKRYHICLLEIGWTPDRFIKEYQFKPVDLSARYVEMWKELEAKEKDS